MIPRKVAALIFVLAITLTACAPPAAPPLPTLAATTAVAATTISMSAATPSPVTATPLPTLTPTPVTPTLTPVTEIIFTGSLVPARCVQAAIDEVGQADFLYDDVRELLSEADLTVGNLNATISDYPPHTGCVQTFVLVGSANNADAMARAGFDLMSVATNHIKNCGLTNCGDRAFFDTLANLHRVKINTVGAGEDLDAAMAPVVVMLHGTRFGFVSLGELEPRAFAGTNTPGIAVLTDESLVASIAAVRAISDVVIFMPHWGPENSAMPHSSQLRFAQVAVQAGADLIVGSKLGIKQSGSRIASAVSRCSTLRF